MDGDKIMNDLIKNIVTNNKRTTADRNKELDELAKDIEEAKGLLSGKYTYCKICDDFYLSKSFFEEKETKESRICVYEDFINSGGNQYADGYIDIVYKVCPKGHKHEISRTEREKLRRV